MHFSHLSALAAALPLAASATTGYLPWKVTSVNTWQPSGRPGSSSTWFEIANITNPDPTQTSTDAGLTQGTVVCQIEWSGAEAPYNEVYNCDVVGTSTPSPWAWSISLIHGSVNPVNDFNLRWRAASTVAPADPSKGWTVYTAFANFAAGKNLDYLCAASGSCSASLSAASAPVSVAVSSVTCTGSLEEALQGSTCSY